MIRQAVAALGPTTWVLAALVALGPLPFGAVQVRDRSVLAVAAFLALALALAAERGARATLVRVRLPALALVGVAAVGLLQSLPWPRPLARLLFWNGVEAWERARELLAVPAGWLPLSLTPETSRAAALLWLAAAAAFAAAAVIGHRRGARRAVLLALLAGAVFEVVYGADNWFRRSGEIWSTAVPGDSSRLRGTFVNPDHFAFFLLVAVTACHGWLWWAFRRLSQNQSLERSLVLVALPGLAFLTFFAGLAFTGSRAGFVAGAVGIAAQAAVLAAHYRRWQAALSGLAVLLLGGVGVAFFGLQAGIGRWLETSAYEVGWGARTRLYAATLELFARFPLTGSGLGSFRAAFPVVQPGDLPGGWYHAHSDLLELLATTGLLGPLLVAVGAAALCRRLWTVVERGRRSEDRAAGLAALGAVAAAAAHSMVDFALTIPANAVVLAVVCGLGAGAATLSEEEHRAALAARRGRRSSRRRSAAQPAASPSSETSDTAAGVT